MPFIPENRPPRSPKTGYPPQDIALRKAATTRKITGRRKAADGRASARTHRADDTTAGGDPHNASRTASVPAWIFCSNERGISCKPVSCRRTDSNPTGQRHTRAIPDTPDKAPGSLPGGYSKNGSSARRPASHSLSAPPGKIIRPILQSINSLQINYPQISNTAPYRNDHYRHTRFPNRPDISQFRRTKAFCTNIIKLYGYLYFIRTLFTPVSGKYPSPHNMLF